MKIEEIQALLLRGEEVANGYGSTYGFDDVMYECRDLKDILVEVATATNMQNEINVQQIKDELTSAALKVAEQAAESFE